MRPHQWAKNVFLIAALLYSRNIFNPLLLFKVYVGFMLFSLAASSIYILNYIADIENDRLHHKIKNRPLASGSLSISNGLAMASFLTR